MTCINYMVITVSVQVLKGLTRPGSQSPNSFITRTKLQDRSSRRTCTEAGSGGLGSRHGLPSLSCQGVPSLQVRTHHLPESARSSSVPGSHDWCLVGSPIVSRSRWHVPAACPGVTGETPQLHEADGLAPPVPGWLTDPWLQSCRSFSRWFCTTGSGGRPALLQSTRSSRDRRAFNPAGSNLCCTHNIISTFFKFPKDEQPYFCWTYSTVQITLVMTDRDSRDVPLSLIKPRQAGFFLTLGSDLASLISAFTLENLPS